MSLKYNVINSYYLTLPVILSTLVVLVPRLTPVNHLDLFLQLVQEYQVDPVAQYLLHFLFHL